LDDFLFYTSIYYYKTLFVMSTSTTNFTCKNGSITQDLSITFQPISLGGKNTNPTYYYSNGEDLSNIFAKNDGSNFISFNTNYLVNNVDLKNIFAPYMVTPRVTISGTNANNVTRSVIINNVHWTMIYNTNSGIIPVINQNVSSSVKIYFCLVGGGAGGVLIMRLIPIAVVAEAVVAVVVAVVL
jgi:hypothetical protein